MGRAQNVLIMKSKIAIGVLVVVCIVLGVMLSREKEQAEQQQKKASTEIGELTTKRDLLQNKLGDQEAVNAKLTNDVMAAREQVKNLEGTLTKAREDIQAGQLAQQAAQQRINNLQEQLTASKSETAMARQQNVDLAAKSQQEIAARDARINDLNSNNDELTKKISGLNISIQGLEKNIVETERKLAAAEGDREFLVKELKRLQAEKAELEQRMKDLAYLRDQVRQLREELNIARRLDWIRRGIYGAGEIKKGSQIMQEALTQPKASQPGHSLEVEITRDGAVKVAPGTNAPPPAPKPQ
jgi:chromosome segregation ATPase